MNKYYYFLFFINFINEFIKTNLALIKLILKWNYYDDFKPENVNSWNYYSF